MKKEYLIFIVRIVFVCSVLAVLFTVVYAFSTVMLKTNEDILYRNEVIKNMDECEKYLYLSRDESLGIEQRKRNYDMVEFLVKTEKCHI